MNYFYDVDIFRKKLSRRTWTVVSLFILFVIFNSLQIAESERLRFLTLFVPIFLIFFWFLRKNYLKQVEILSKGKIVLDDNNIQQFDSYGNCATIAYKDIEKIIQNKFRGYERVILETKDKFYPIVNLKGANEFVKTVHSRTNATIEIDSTEDQLFHKWTAVYFLPTFITALVYTVPFLKESFAGVTAEILLLVANMNILVYLLNFKEKDEYLVSKFSLRRRLLFIFGLSFLFQVYKNLETSGILKKVF